MNDLPFVGQVIRAFHRSGPSAIGQVLEVYGETPRGPALVFYRVGMARYVLRLDGTERWEVYDPSIVEITNPVEVPDLLKKDHKISKCPSCNNSLEKSGDPEIFCTYYSKVDTIWQTCRKQASIKCSHDKCCIARCSEHTNFTHDKITHHEDYHYGQENYGKTLCESCSTEMVRNTTVSNCVCTFFRYSKGRICGDDAYLMCPNVKCWVGRCSVHVNAAMLSEEMSMYGLGSR